MSQQIDSNTSGKLLAGESGRLLPYLIVLEILKRNAVEPYEFLVEIAVEGE